MATITKIQNAKGVTYRAQIRKFAEGKLVYSEAATFNTKTLAQKWAGKREGELTPQAISRKKQSGLTVGDLVKKYQTDYADSESAKKGMRLLLAYDFALCPLESLTSEMLMEHARNRLKTVKPSTLEKDFMWLAMVYHVAYAAWGIKVDASELDAARALCSKKGMTKQSTERERRPTPVELERLSAYFLEREEVSRMPMHDIMWFAIHSSRRQGEITRLRWADNNDEKQTGLVTDLKHPTKKAGNHKRFKYTPEAWKIAQRQPKTSEFIFPYDPQVICNYFHDACKILEIHDLRFHDLRREAVSRLFESGYSITEVVQFSLHQSWQQLRRYTEIKPEDVVVR